MGIDAIGLQLYITIQSMFNLATDNIISKDHYFIRPNQTLSDIPTDIHNLFMKKYNCSSITNSITFGDQFNTLKIISICHNCLQNVSKLVLDGLENLESVKIGEKCFRIDDNKECDDGICRIVNCPNLAQLEIGCDSFDHFKSFELSNLNSLQSICFKDGCFNYADFVLKGE